MMQTGMLRRSHSSLIDTLAMVAGARCQSAVAPAAVSLDVRAILMWSRAAARRTACVERDGSGGASVDSLHNALPRYGMVLLLVAVLTLVAADI